MGTLIEVMRRKIQISLNDNECATRCPASPYQEGLSTVILFL